MLMRSPSSSIRPSALRAIAALAIAVHHGLAEADGVMRRLGGAFPWQNVWPLSAGVDLFLRDLRLCHGPSPRPAFNGNAGSAWPFLRRRLARIVPIYWATTALFLALMFSGLAPLNAPRPGAAEVAASFLFIPFMRADGYVQPVYGLGWTLNYEMAFLSGLRIDPAARTGSGCPASGGAPRSGQYAWTIHSCAADALHFWTRPIILEFALGAMIGHMARPNASDAEGRRRHGAGRHCVAGRGAGLSAALPQERVLLYGLPSALLLLAALSVDEVFSARWARPLVSLRRRLLRALLLPPAPIRVAWRCADRRSCSGDCLAMALSDDGHRARCGGSWIVWRWFEKPLTRALQGRSLPVRGDNAMNKTTHGDVAGLKLYGNIIDGVSVQAADGRTLECVCPSDGRAFAPCRAPSPSISMPLSHRPAPHSKRDRGAA